MADWNKIRAEYIRGDTSYRKLAEKYKVPMNTLKRVAKQGNWVELRAQKEHKVTTQLTEIAASTQSEAAKIIFNAAIDLARKVAKSIEQQEVFLPGDAYGYANAMQKIKQTIGIKDDIDLEEQQARIAKIKSETAVAEEVTQGKVIVIPARVAVEEEKDG